MLADVQKNNKQTKQSIFRISQAKLANGCPALLDDEQNALALLLEQARYKLN